MQSSIDQLIRTLVPLMASRLTGAAAGTVLLYNIMLNFSDEMKYIWPSKFSLPKCLYFVNRYFPVPCLLLAMYYMAGFRGDFQTACKLLAIFQLLGQQLSLITATWLLVIRVLALYGDKRFVEIGLYALFISTHLVSTVLGIIVMRSVWDLLKYSSSVGLCVSSPQNILGIVYFTPVLCEVVLVLMQLLHAYRYTRQLGTLPHPVTPLLRTLYLDGFAYFVIVVTLRLWSALTLLIADPSYWYLSVYLELSLISVSVSRLALHLREAAEAGHSNSLDVSTTFSDIPTNPTPIRNHRHGQGDNYS